MLNKGLKLLRHQTAEVPKGFVIELPCTTLASTCISPNKIYREKLD